MLENSYILGFGMKAVGISETPAIQHISNTTSSTNNTRGIITGQKKKTPIWHTYVRGLQETHKELFFITSITLIIIPATNVGAGADARLVYMAQHSHSDVNNTGPGHEKVSTSCFNIWVSSPSSFKYPNILVLTIPHSSDKIWAELEVITC